MEDVCGLRSKKCAPCTAATPPLTEERRMALHAQVPEWKIDRTTWPDGTWLWRELIFKNFAEAVGFIMVVATIAEEDDHHPSFELHGYRRVKFRLTTHAIGDLSENDFVLAAKIDAMAEEIGR